MNNSLKIREIRQAAIPFLDEMLYEAIFVPERDKKLPKDIIKQAELSRYISDFGRLGDICLVAEIQGRLVGAIWVRMFKVDETGFGFVDATTPELSMAVSEQWIYKIMLMVSIKNMALKIII